MTDDERALLILLARAAMPQMPLVRELIENINMAEAEKAPKPPKFPIGSRVVANDLVLGTPLGVYIYSGDAGLVASIYHGSSDLFNIRFDNGFEAWVQEDNLTAVDDESDVESDDDYRKRLLAVFEDMSLGFKLLLRAYREQLSTSSGEVLDAYGDELGIVRRGTEGAKK